MANTDNYGPTSGSAPDHNMKTAGDTVREAREGAEEAASRVKDEVRDGYEQAKGAVHAETEAQKNRVAGAVSETAESLKTAAGEVEEGSTQQQILRETADRLSAFAHSVEGQSLGEMIDGVSDFARRNPVTFLGGAALLGFAGSRFARASKEARDRDDLRNGHSGDSDAVGGMYGNGGQYHGGSPASSQAGRHAGAASSASSVGVTGGAAASSGPANPAAPGRSAGFGSSGESPSTAAPPSSTSPAAPGTTVSHVVDDKKRASGASAPAGTSTDPNKKDG